VNIELSLALTAFRGAVDETYSLGSATVYQANLLNRCIAAPPPASSAPPPLVPVGSSPATGGGSTSGGAAAVNATGSFGACAYGSSCLLVGFSVSGFNPVPTVYTCIFGDGTRYNFSFSGTSVSTACYTNDRPDSVQVEVGGVRSVILTTTPAAPSAPLPPPPPPPSATVSVTGRVGSCPYGSNCLIAAFSIANFGSQPTTYTCIFQNGSRYNFGFTGSSVATACYTADKPDSITVEVNGVRSNTITVAAPAPTPPSAPTFAETTGGATNTWTNYSNAGGSQGPTIPSNTTVQVSCKLPGMAVADGNTWWYRIASSPWNNVYYASADAFYNNGSTSGSLHGTPFVDGAVANC
jgi:hypothetical protein